MELLSVPWIVFPIVLPLLAAILAFVLRTRAALAVSLLAALGIVVTVAGLTAQVATEGAQSYPIGGWEAPLGIELYADGLSVLMLIMTALVGAAGSLYASGYFGQERAAGVRPGDYLDRYGAFWPLWMFLWSSMNILFLSADVFNLYISLEILGLSAVALVTLAGGRRAVTAGMRYLLVSLLGSLAYLLAVALLYGAYGTLNVQLLGELVEAGPTAFAALALVALGMALKTALFPLHFWLPRAYADAPSPASALLAGLTTKASFYLLVRLWFDVFPEEMTPAAGELLGILGAVAIVWGAILAVRQERLKALIAYSSVSQIGYFFLLFPLTTGSAGFEAWSGGVYYAFSHGFATAAMFMAAGVIVQTLEHDRIKDMEGLSQHLPLTIASFAVAGVTLMGLPPSGGFTAKWLLLSAAIDNNRWDLVVVIIGGSLLAAVYVFRILNRALLTITPTDTPRGPRPQRLEAIALALALVSALLALFSGPLLDLLQTGAPFAPALVGWGAW